MSRNRAAARWVAIAVVAAAVSLSAAPAGGLASIRSQDLRDWLSYIASDDLEGRAVYTEGLGMAASYIEDHLREWGATPAGDHGSVPPDGARPRREIHQPFDRHGRGGGRVAHLRRRPGRSSSRRTSAASGASRSIGSSSPATGSTRRSPDTRTITARTSRAPRSCGSARRARRASTAGSIAARSPGETATRPSSSARWPASVPSCPPSAAAAGAGARAAGGGSGRTRRADSRGRLHDRPAARRPGAAEREREGRVLRVPLQPRADALRRAEAAGGGPGAAARRSGSTASR